MTAPAENKDMITRAEAQEIADQAATQAVVSTFHLLGIDVDNPDKRTDFRKTWEHAQARRLTEEEASRMVKKSFFTVILPAAMLSVLVFMWNVFSDGFRQFLIEFLGGGKP
jgi:hypothetical protein